MPRMSHAEVQAYMARQFKEQRRDATSSGVPVEDESLLHNQIICECKLRGWIAFHGSMAHSTFRTEGEPDFVILMENGRTVLVECKSKTGKISPAQLGIKAWASRLGHHIHVIRSFGEFIDLVDQKEVL